MKYILLVICVVCASTMMAVDYKLHQTSSFKTTSSTQFCSGSEVGSMIAYTSVANTPAIHFQSTSVMSGTGSKLPQAAVSGVMTTDESNNSTVSGPRRIGGGNSGGGDGPANPDDPWKTPLGDAVLPLLLLAAGYVIYLRRKNSVRIPESGHQQ